MGHRAFWILTALVLAACGGGSAETSDAAPPAATTPAVSNDGGNAGGSSNNEPATSSAAIVVPPGFDFSTSQPLAVRMDLDGSVPARAYLTICRQQVGTDGAYLGPDYDQCLFRGSAA